MSLQSAYFRTICAISDAVRDRGLKTPADIRRINNIPYGPEVAWNTLDVYRPKAAEGETAGYCKHTRRRLCIREHETVPVLLYESGTERFCGGKFQLPACTGI